MLLRSFSRLRAGAAVAGTASVMPLRFGAVRLLSTAALAPRSVTAAVAVRRTLPRSIERLIHTRAVVRSTPAAPNAAGSTPPPPPPPPFSPSNSGGIVGRFQTGLFDNRDRIRTYLVYATALGGALLILKGGVWLVEFFADINFADVGEWAYVAGVISGLALVGVWMAGKRLISIRPEPVYRMALKNVTSNPKVTLRLGESLVPGKFRAYSVIEGGIRFSSGGKKYDGWQRYWKPKRVQMLFSLTGSRGTGMISAEVQNDYKGKPYYRMLALDILDGKAEHVHLEGDPAYKIDHGVIKLG